MSVRIEKLHAAAPSLTLPIVFGIAWTVTTKLVRWWQRPAPMTMSEDWLANHARFESQRGWQ